MKGALNPFTSAIIGCCLPGGQLKPFPDNGMSLMTQSGAKGSGVNFSQISCLLGQQELEGRRVPCMATGRTLPAFRPHEPSPRAGGFITDRFLTGVRPAEFFFHCMAGREGLIDTAVKTSRSGYLQRCLVKHLESLTVQYDYTVRDCDGSVVQFHYGEDSVDVSKSAHLTRFAFLASNWRPLLHKLNPPAAIQALDTTAVDAYRRSTQGHGGEGGEGGAAEPLLSLFSPGAHLGAVSDSFAAAVSEYAAQDPDGLLLASSRPASSQSPRAVSSDKFSALMSLHYLYSLVPAGESVGVLAAQSIGEPSTQMTLNTFHLAGHGGGNVTLGIPRLREIVMTASASIRTPFMRLPMLDPQASRQQAEDVAARLTRLSLPDFLTAATVTESVETSEAGAAFRLYSLRLSLPALDSAAVLEARLSFANFQRCIAQQLAPRLNAAVKKEVRALQSRHAVSPVVLAVHRAAAASRGATTAEDGEEAGTSSRRRRHRDAEDDAVSAKESRRRHESVSYDEPDEDERRIIDEADRRDSEADEGDEVDDAPQPDAEQQEEEEGPQQEEGGAGSPSSSSPDWLSAVLSRCPYLRSISFDPKQGWATVVVAVSLSLPKLLIMSLLEAAVEGCLLRATPGISRAVVIEQKPQPASASPPVSHFAVATDGVNFRELLLYSDCLALDALYSNDVAALLRQYGVEAARTAITREIQAVFSPYGISVDYRHLSLLADYMTVSGEFRPLNRSGLSSSTSAFQKMTFETSISFLREAALLSDTDRLHSPSARIVVGEPVACGTGAFELMQPIAMTRHTEPDS